MRVVFLDIDGVVNTPANWGKRPAIKAMTPELVKRVWAFVKATDSNVVISSTWRVWHPLEDIRTMLELNGFEDTSRIIDKTPNFEMRNGAMRQDEILAWLADHPQVRSWVILDDNTGGDPDWSKVMHRWVRVDPNVGFSDGDIIEAQEKLHAA